MKIDKVRKAIDVLYRSLLFELKRRKPNIPYLDDILFQPKTATFNITDNCNGRCITCNAWKQKSENELTTDEVINILGQLKNVGVSNIGFAGGEPLLRRDLPEIIQEASNLGFERISLITNALLLNKDKAKELLESGLNSIGISIDGLEKTNDMIRGIKGHYKKSISALKTLVELRDSEYHNLDIWVSTTLTKFNLSEIPKIIQMCINYNIRLYLNLLDTNPYFLADGAGDLVIRDLKKLYKLVDELHKIKRKYPKVLSHSHVALEYIRKYFKDPKREDIPCYLGYHFIYIGSHGEVYSGCWVLKPLGNLRDKSLREIITSEKYKKRLHDMLMKKCPGCSCGYTSNLSYHLPSLFEEILWILGIRRVPITKTDKSQVSQV